MALPRTGRADRPARRTGQLLVLGRPERAGHGHRALWLGEKAPCRTPTPALAEAQLATRDRHRPPRRRRHRRHVGNTAAGRRALLLRPAALAGGATSDLRGEKLLEDEDPAARITNVAAEAPLHRALGFVKDKLPSFLAPPSTFAPTEPPTPAAGLRLAHASCRRPGSGAVDVLPGLVELVKSDATRPHQLHPHCDQIYADDVATPFLPLVAAIGAELTGPSRSQASRPTRGPAAPDRHR